MKYTLVFVVLPVLALLACRPEPPQLAGSWQATELNIARFEQEMKNQQATIDTMGAHTDSATNIEFYGSNNFDSIRMAMSDSLVVYRNKQQVVTKHFRYEFRTDSVVIIRALDMTDSAKWYYEEADMLVLDEKKLKGYGDLLRLQVLELSDSTLKVRNTDPQNTITTTFRRVK